MVLSVAGIDRWLITVGEMMAFLVLTVIGVTTTPGSACGVAGEYGGGLASVVDCWSRGIWICEEGVNAEGLTSGLACSSVGARASVSI
jgi:hypothetical protein